MSEDSVFRDLIRRVRAGEEAAAAELVRLHEPVIRRVVRLKLRLQPALRRVLDSMDICQSVLSSFFVRAASGQFELDQPEDLCRLLAIMTRNKVIDQGRKPHVRHEEQPPDTAGPEERGSAAADPGRLAAGKDLLEQVRRRLSAEEHYLAEQRLLGRSWIDLAAEVGDSPDALRKKHARALDRVAHQLQLDEFHHE